MKPPLALNFSLDSLRHALDRPAGRAGEPPLPRLEYPLFPAPRVAVLGLRVSAADGIYCLPEWEVEDLRRLRPAALAGSWNDLSEVARRLLLGELELPDLLYPIVVFTTPASSPLAPRLHDRLWDWFRVPTYEQIRGARGELLAYECDARRGFHLAPGADLAGFGFLPSAHPCPCGSAAPLCFASARTAAAG